MSVDKLGMRVRRFREAQEMSREDLANTAGVTVSVIEALEDANIYASIAPLQKIAQALGLRLGTFMDDVSTQDPVIVRAAERAADLDLAMHKSAAGKTAYRYHSLGKGKNDRNMEPFYVEIEPDEEVSLSSHQGEEFIIVVSGKLKVIYGREDFVLERGDTIYYNSIVPHFVGAAGNEPCAIFAIIYHP